jgi:hypothetical protein
MKPAHPILFLSFFAAVSSAFAGEPEIYKAYDGPDVPIEQQVVLKVTQNYPGFHLIEKPEVGLFAYDGKRMGSFLSSVKHADEYHFLPGKHVVAFRVKRGTMLGYTNLWFVGVAGKTYSTQLETSVFRYDLWLQDDATGKPVGGKQGSRDEPKAQAPAPATKPTPVPPPDSASSASSQ